SRLNKRLLLLRRQRRRPWRRLALAGPDVRGPALLVLLGRQLLQLRLAARHRLPVQLLQERNAPPAAGAGAAALRELARHLRAVDADEVEQLPLGHVKAVTDLAVDVHDSLTPSPAAERDTPFILADSPSGSIASRRRRSGRLQ